MTVMARAAKAGAIWSRVPAWISPVTGPSKIPRPMSTGISGTPNFFDVRFARTPIRMMPPATPNASSTPKAVFDAAPGLSKASSGNT